MIALNIVPLIARILFASTFLWYGRNHFTNYDGISGYADFVGVPVPGAATIIGGALLVVGALSILLGFYARIGAVLLIAFLVPALFLVHDYWNIDDAAASSTQEVLFFRNLSFIGAALFVTYFGSGPLSLDEEIRKRREAPASEPQPA